MRFNSCKWRVWPAAFLMTVFLGGMARTEEVVSVIRENCSGVSNCYTSLSAWEAAYGGVDFSGCAAGNLVCADVSAVARIEGSWTNPDTTAVTVNGWTTGPDNYIRIYTAPEARHDGKWKDTAYRLQTTGQSMHINEENVRLDGLQIFMNNTSFAQWQRGILINLGTAAADIRISNSIIRSNGNIGNNSGGLWFETTGAGSKYYITNTLIYGFKTNGDYASGVRSLNGNWTGYLYNVTSNNNDYGFRNSGGTMIAKNSYAGGNSHAAYNGTIGKTNCASSDGTGSAGLTSVAYSVSGGASFNNITLANEDFHIKSNSALKDSGVNTSTEAAPLNFNTDIDGQTRAAPWDIGADELASSQSDLTPPSAPETFAAVAVSSTQINISWTASTDNVGVAGYWVYRDSTHIATVTATAYSNTGLSPASVYNYMVSAVDAAGNESGRVNASTQTLPASSGSVDQTSPTVTIVSPANGSTVSGSISLAGIAGDNVALSRVDVRVNSGSFNQASGLSSWNYSIDTLALSNGAHTFTARATDASGNAVQQNITLTVNNVTAPPVTGNAKRINVQGKLTDPAGTPLSGPKVVTFRLYQTSTGPVSSMIWEDSIGVNLVAGLFNVALGQNASLDSIAFDRPLYVGFQVAGDATEMTPRQLLGASAYALGSIGDFHAGNNLIVNGTIRGASWGFGGSYSVDSCNTNTTVNPLTSAASCPAGFTAYPVGKFKAGDSNCADTLYVCVK